MIWRLNNQLNYRVVLFVRTPFFLMTAKVQHLLEPANVFQKKCSPNQESTHFQAIYFL
jgi:hypothetical protein